MSELDNNNLGLDGNNNTEDDTAGFLGAMVYVFWTIFMISTNLGIMPQELLAMHYSNGFWESTLFNAVGTVMHYLMFAFAVYMVAKMIYHTPTNEVMGMLLAVIIFSPILNILLYIVAYLTSCVLAIFVCTIIWLVTFTAIDPFH